MLLLAIRIAPLAPEIRQFIQARVQGLPIGPYGKLHVEGLGGSYGVERLAWYRMLPEMGPPETTIWEYPMADNSAQLEMQEFIEDIRLAREPAASLKDALAALAVVERIYEQSGYDYRT